MERERRGNYTHSYIEGNTVRKLEAVPDYRREQEEKKREAERRRNRRVARRNQERVSHMNLRYVAFLTLSLLLVGGSSVVYIRLQTNITGHLNTISALESDITALRSDNDALEKRIETSVDLKNVKDRALNELGMVYASPEQIVHYTIDKEDYMNQYEDIPGK